MAEAEARLEGFTLAEGLWRLLGRPGQDEGLQAFRATHGLEEGIDPMALILTEADWQVRPALQRGEDLDGLEGPALLELKAGGWVLLQGRCRAGFRALTPRGPTRVPSRELRPALTGRSLARLQALGPGSRWQRLGRLAGTHRGALLQLACAALLLQVLGLAGPFSTGAILNRALPDGADSLLTLAAAGLLLVALFQTWLSWFRGRVLLYLAGRLELATARGFMGHLLSLPFPALEALTVGERLQAFEGLAAARAVLLERVLGSLLDGGMACVQLAAMAWLLPGATLGVVLTTLVIGALSLASGWVQARLQARSVQAQAREQGLLVELLSGIQTLKAAGAEGLARQRWGGTFARVLDLGLRQGRLRLGTQAGAAALGQGLAAGLMLWGGRRVLAGTLGLGTLFAFLQLSAGFMAASLGVVDAALALLLVRPQLAKAEAIQALAPEPPVPGDPDPPAPGPVLMEDVWFRYGPERPWVLAGFNLRVEPGGRHRLQGGSGSGKTTLLRLLAGLYPPERGTITIAGVPPRHARPALLYLPQATRLLEGTVLDNLRLLSGGAPREALLQAARRTGLQALAATLPMGYDTPLPHGGATLSGGQRQLIALTAALASGRQVLLLDEAMASLDPARSEAIARALARGSWTVISASHRPAEGPGEPSDPAMMEGCG